MLQYLSTTRRENMALRDYQRYQEDYVYQELPEEQLPLYQEYIPESDVAPKLSELLFFFNIATFCVLTAIFSFVFLSFKLNTFIAIALALTLSFATIQLSRFISRKKSKKTTALFLYLSSFFFCSF